MTLLLLQIDMLAIFVVKNCIGLDTPAFLFACQKSPILSFPLQKYSGDMRSAVDNGDILFTPDSNNFICLDFRTKSFIISNEHAANTILDMFNP